MTLTFNAALRPTSGADDRGRRCPSRYGSATRGRCLSSFANASCCSFTC